MTDELIHLSFFIFFILLIYWLGGPKASWYFLIVVLLGVLIARYSDLNKIIKEAGA